MTQIYELKDKIVRFHAEYEVYLAYVYKFIVAFVLFCLINAKIGFMERIAELPVSLILALVCSLEVVFSFKSLSSSTQFAICFSIKISDSDFAWLSKNI